MKTEALLDQLAGQLAPVRPAPGPGGLALGWSGAALLLSLLPLFILHGWRVDMAGQFHRLQFLAVVLTLGGALFTSARLGFLLSLPGRLIRPLDSAAPPGFVLAFLVALSARPLPGADALRAGLTGLGLYCSLELLLLAFLPGILFFLLARRLASVDPALSARAGGLAMAATGALALSCHCGVENLSHLLLYHALPVILLVPSVGALGARALRW